MTPIPPAPRRRRPASFGARCLVAAGLVLAAVAAGRRPAIAGSDPRTPTPADAALLADYRPPTPAAHPADNAPTAERRELGKLLFFDGRLSRTGTVSCASCHDPKHGWSDSAATSVGVAGHRLGRRSQTVLNTAWAAALFWDGRAETLEQQALGPVTSVDEMDLPLARLEQRLNAVSGYRARFKAAYGLDSITANAVARAVAQFERSLVSGEAPFDRWVAGDASAVSEEAKRGFRVFAGKGGCAQCHGGWRFTDDSFHDIGVPVAPARPDSGRGALVPGIDVLQFAFKTPTLRNVAERAPYLHDGSARTLAEVVDLYDRGGVDAHGVRRPSVSPMIQPLHLTAAERSALVAFMATLSSPDTVVAPARLPR